MAREYLVMGLFPISLGAPQLIVIELLFDFVRITFVGADGASGKNN